MDIVSVTQHAPEVSLRLTAMEAYQLKSMVQNGSAEESLEESAFRHKLFNGLPSFERLIEWIQLP